MKGGRMKAVAYNDPIRQRVIVLIEAGVDSSNVQHYLNAEGDAVPVRLGEEPPIYLSLDMRVAAEVAKVLTPQPDVTARHLDDALAMRDRLLTMVEAR
jgi:hypothetical protein